MLIYYYPTILDYLVPRYTWRKKDRGVYLTFDDGPVPEATLELLDILKRHRVKATFFCVGDNVQKHPEVFKRIIEEGHSVGNHTYNHLNGEHTNTKEYLQNIEDCDKIFREHNVTTNLFRPPHGRMTKEQRDAIPDKYDIIMWSVLSWDFNPSVSVQKCLEKSTKYTKEGRIVLFHDSVKTIDKVRRVLPRYIKEVKAKGLKFKCL